ncbi:MAG: hypothetical protein MK135_08910 [Polyangiaceae bacterium]|nr:hypothetical protein [Polyangiaceae bacterium]
MLSVLGGSSAELCDAELDLAAPDLAAPDLAERFFAAGRGCSDCTDAASSLEVEGADELSASVMTTGDWAISQYS